MVVWVCRHHVEGEARIAELPGAMAERFSTTLAEAICVSVFQGFVFGTAAEG